MSKILEEKMFYNKSSKKIAKGIFTVFLSIILFFIKPGMVFAENNKISNHSENIIKINTAEINQETFLISRSTENNEFSLSDYSSYSSHFIWVASMILPGLGQLIMGNSTGWFYIISYLILVPIDVSIIKASSPTGDNFGFLFAGLLGVGLTAFLAIFYLINVFQAYYENKQNVKEFNQEAQAIINSIEKTQISNNTISFKLISF